MITHESAGAVLTGLLLRDTIMLPSGVLCIALLLNRIGRSTVLLLAPLIISIVGIHATHIIWHHDAAQLWLFCGHAIAPLIVLLFWQRSAEITQPQLYAVLSWAALLIIAAMTQFNTGWSLYIGTELITLIALRLSFSVTSMAHSGRVAIDWWRWVFWSGSIFIVLGLILVSTQNERSLLTNSGVLCVIGGISIKITAVLRQAWQLAGMAHIAATRTAALLAVLFPTFILLALIQWLAAVHAVQFVFVIGIIAIGTGILLRRRWRSVAELLVIMSGIQLGIIAVVSSLTVPTELYMPIAWQHLFVTAALFALTLRWSGRELAQIRLLHITPRTLTLLLLLSLTISAIPPLPGFWLQLWFILQAATHHTLLTWPAITIALFATLLNTQLWLTVIPLVLKRTRKQRMCNTSSAPQSLLHTWRFTFTPHWLDNSFATIVGALAIITPIVLFGDVIVTMRSQLLTVMGHLWAQLLMSAPPHMNALTGLLLTSLLTIIIAIITGRWRWSLPFILLGYAAQFWFLTQTQIPSGHMVSVTLPVVLPALFPIHGFTIDWHYGGLAWLLALITIGAGFITTWMLAELSAPAEQTRRHLINICIAIQVTAALSLFGSDNWLMLLFNWEIVTWLGWLLLFVQHRPAWSMMMHQVRPLLTGSALLLLGMAQWIALTHDVHLTALANISNPPPLLTIGFWCCVAGAFALRLGLFPFSNWQVLLHQSTPASSVLFATTVVGRLGVFGLLLGLFTPTALAQLTPPATWWVWFNLHTLLFTSALFTIGWATVRALQQTDIRALLAWLGIAQLGYILFGFLTANHTGAIGSLLQLFSDALALGVLWLGMMSIAHRCGTTQWLQFAGVARQLPYTASVIIIGAASYIGLPPTIGFTAKWSIYQTLLADGWFVAAGIALLGTIGTAVALARVSIVLWQRPASFQYAHLTEPSAVLLAPLLGLAALIILTGLLPHGALQWATIAWHSFN